MNEERVGGVGNREDVEQRRVIHEVTVVVSVVGRSLPPWTNVGNHLG